MDGPRHGTATVSSLRENPSAIARALVRSAGVSLVAWARSSSGKAPARSISAICWRRRMPHSPKQSAVRHVASRKDEIRRSRWSGSKSRAPTRLSAFRRMWTGRRARSTPSSPGATIPRSLIVSEHGTEFASSAIFACARSGWIAWRFIAPGLPLQNGVCEAFNGRMHGEVLNETVFNHSRSRPRRVRSPDNTPAPALGYLASAAFAGAFTATGGRLRNPKQLRRDERCLQRREISGSILDADGASFRGREPAVGRGLRALRRYRCALCR